MTTEITLLNPHPPRRNPHEVKENIHLTPIPKNNAFLMFFMFSTYCTYCRSKLTYRVRLKKNNHQNQSTFQTESWSVYACNFTPLVLSCPVLQTLFSYWVISPFRIDLHVKFWRFYHSTWSVTYLSHQCHWLSKDPFQVHHSQSRDLLSSVFCKFSNLVVLCNTHVSTRRMVLVMTQSHRLYPDVGGLWHLREPLE